MLASVIIVIVHHHGYTLFLFFHGYILATCVQDAAAGSLEVAVEPAQYSLPTNDIPSLLTQNPGQVCICICILSQQTTIAKSKVKGQLTRQKMRPPFSPQTPSPKAPSDKCGALSLCRQSEESQIEIEHWYRGEFYLAAINCPSVPPIKFFGKLPFSPNQCWLKNPREGKVRHMIWFQVNQSVQEDASKDRFLLRGDLPNTKPQPNHMDKGRSALSASTVVCLVAGRPPFEFSECKLVGEGNSLL